MRNMVFTGLFYGQQITLKQVNRKTAKNLHASGVSVFIQSSNYHPLGVWSPAQEIKPDHNFEEYVNAFSWCNCSNKETGKYPVFYQSV